MYRSKLAQVARKGKFNKRQLSTASARVSASAQESKALKALVGGGVAAVALAATMQDDNKAQAAGLPFGASRGSSTRLPNPGKYASYDLAIREVLSAQNQIIQGFRFTVAGIAFPNGIDGPLQQQANVAGQRVNKQLNVNLNLEVSPQYPDGGAVTMQAVTQLGQNATYSAELTPSTGALGGNAAFTHVAGVRGLSAKTSAQIQPGQAAYSEFKQEVDYRGSDYNVHAEVARKGTGKDVLKASLMQSVTPTLAAGVQLTRAAPVTSVQTVARLNNTTEIPGFDEVYTAATDTRQGGSASLSYVRKVSKFVSVGSQMMVNRAGEVNTTVGLSHSGTVAQFTASYDTSQTLASVVRMPITDSMIMTLSGAIVYGTPNSAFGVGLEFRS